MNVNEEMLAMLFLMLVILMLMLLNLNTGYADTDADLCIRIMPLCCTWGIDAVRFWMEKLPEEFDGRFSKELILEGLILILENNNFHFFTNQRQGNRH